MATTPIPMNRTAGRLMQWSLVDVFNNKGVQVQRFTWDPTQQTTFFGEQGTKISLLPHTIRNTVRASSTEPVALEFVELYDKAQMVFAGKTTTSEDALLHAYGQLFLQIRQGHAILPFDQPITVALPKPVAGKIQTTHHRLFKTIKTVTRPFGQKAGLDWKAYHTDSILNMGEETIQLSVQQPGWIQCAGNLPGRYKKVMVSARYHSNYGPLDEKMAYLIFHDFNAVARMYPQSRHFTAFNMPEGLAATVVILGRRKSMYFIGTSELVQTANTMVQVPMQLKPIDKIITMLKRSPYLCS
jgi:hypothetical protein